MKQKEFFIIFKETETRPLELLRQKLKAEAKVEAESILPFFYDI